MAHDLYYEFMDMDNMDYAETYEQDIAFIEALVEAIGYNATRNVLKEMTE